MRNYELGIDNDCRDASMLLRNKHTLTRLLIRNYDC